MLDHGVEAGARKDADNCYLGSASGGVRRHFRPSAATRWSRRRGAPSHARHRDHELFGTRCATGVGEGRTREAQSGRETQGRPHIGGDPGIANRDLDRATEKLPQGPSRIIPRSSLTAANGGISSERNPMRDEPRRRSLEYYPFTRSRKEGASRQGGGRQCPRFR